MNPTDSRLAAETRQRIAFDKLRRHHLAIAGIYEELAVLATPDERLVKEGRA